MRVKLTVLKGKSAGKSLSVKVPQFLIGRAEGCQLKPQSDAISRRHCVIMVHDTSVTIRDLGSRNGTHVNGEATEGEVPLVTGDQIRVGPLELEVTLLDAKGNVITASKQDVTEAAAPATAAAASGGDDILDWLMDEPPAADIGATQEISVAETRQFDMEDTGRIELEKSAEEEAKAKAESEKEERKKKKKKKEYGKLPPPPKVTGADSQEAANAALRKMIQRGG